MGGVEGLAHVGITVSDMERSKRFYCELLGFSCYYELELEKPEGTMKLAFLRCEDCAIELVCPPSPAQPVHAAKPPCHLALRVTGIEELVQTLKEADVVFETAQVLFHETMFGGTKFVFFAGPDGERIELSEVLHRTMEQMSPDELEARALDALTYPVEVTDLSHTVRALNRCARRRERTAGLVGKSLLDCHNETSKRKIAENLERLKAGEEEIYNGIGSFGNWQHMVAIRDEEGALLGYFQLHERLHHLQGK